jgi:hypothetical protein
VSAVELEFYGAVNLLDWWQDPYTDKSYRTIVGHVRVLTETDLGFHLRTSGNANYLFDVEGASGEHVYFPGCKVMGFMRTSKTRLAAVERRPDNVYIVP